ncbi:MAG TPA: DNA recombination protein RmuC [Xanthobacteraceae bacterium]|jgi:DNA recombination protein RmuC|nr:DNA recombination protein RmuC [Xanthobacteraceae bacterium]
MTETILLILAVLVVLLAGGMAALAYMLFRRPSADGEDRRLGELARLQAETSGRLQAMGEALTGRQAELARVLTERLDSVSTRLGASLENNTQQTVDRLQNLHERLVVIDHAQKNLTELSSNVTSLRDVLANKQSRGAFGQASMEAIVQDRMPKGFYEFQYTLTNNTRPDCVVFLPDKRPMVIDAKFPLEAVTALRDAKSEDERKTAAQRIRQDVAKHVTDIAGKYLIPGETQDLALMFVPSESIYAELHDGFDDVVQKAYRARVVIVSPSLLMLAIQVMQQILKDARMREAADQIRTEVGRMMEDLGRLRDRVLKLQQHHTQTGDDLRQILISSEKIEKRATRIEELEFDGDDGAKVGAPDGARSGSNVIAAPVQRRLEAGE